LNFNKRNIAENSLKHLGVKYEAMEHYSKGPPRCVDCGYHDLRDLVLDHTNGGGCEDRRKHCLGIGGFHYYFYLRRCNYPDDLGLEVRCSVCHRKRHKREGITNFSRFMAPVEFDYANPIPNAQEQPLWEGIA